MKKDDFRSGIIADVVFVAYLSIILVITHCTSLEQSRIEVVFQWIIVFGVLYVCWVTLIDILRRRREITRAES